MRVGLHTMTAGELRCQLDDLPADMPLVISVYTGTKPDQPADCQQYHVQELWVDEDEEEAQLCAVYTPTPFNVEESVTCS